jgi:siroheme synthase (precorrin-2 oxidase/ferrochelatase)
VVAATNNRGVNRAIARECAARDIPVSVADCGEESTFYFPAVAIHNTLVAGVSSCGQDHHRVREAAAAIREVLRNEDTDRGP